MATHFSTMTMEQATKVWEGTTSFRKQTLKEAYTSPQAWRSWLDNQIETLAKNSEPTANTVAVVNQYIGYWKAADILVRHKESEDLRHKQNMSALLADFREMKNAK